MFYEYKREWSAVVVKQMLLERLEVFVEHCQYIKWKVLREEESENRSKAMSKVTMKETCWYD